MSSPRKPQTETLEVRGVVLPCDLKTWYYLGDDVTRDIYKPLLVVMFHEARDSDPSFNISDDDINDIKKNIEINIINRFLTPFINPFKWRGWEDLISFLIQDLTFFRPITTGLECILRGIGSGLSYLARLSYEKANESIGWWMLCNIAAIVLWPIGQAFNVIGKTLGYARRTVSSVCNVVSSLLAATVGDGLRSLFGYPCKFWGDEASYPGIFHCIGSLIKNSILLIANTIVIAIAFKTAGLLPAAVNAVAPAFIEGIAIFFKPANLFLKILAACVAATATQGFNFVVDKVDSLLDCYKKKPSPQKKPGTDASQKKESPDLPKLEAQREKETSKEVASPAKKTAFRGSISSNPRLVSIVRNQSMGEGALDNEAVITPAGSMENKQDQFSPSSSADIGGELSSSVGQRCFTP